jgi:hypothetical protein
VASADILLHPVRLRIVQAFLGDRALTTSQLAAAIDDVPLGSLYRHVGLLVKAGVLQVVAEQRVRGAVERTYVLRPSAAQLSPDEAEAMTPQDHRYAFMGFVASLLAEADRYLSTASPDPIRDGFGYRMAALWVTDAELVEFIQDLVRILQPRLANPPTKKRRRLLVANVLLPAPNARRETRRTR